MKINGDCYEVHAKAILDIGDDRPSPLIGAQTMLCHGSVWHPESKRHGHCWLELDEDVVLDVSNGHSVLMRREKYYKVGKVQKVKRYTPEQTRDNLLKYGTYGDWKGGRQ